MKDLISRLTSWKTTILGVFTALAAILSAFGIVSVDEQGQLMLSVNEVWEGVLIVLGGVSGIVLLFSKDSDKE